MISHVNTSGRQDGQAWLVEATTFKSAGAFPEALQATEQAYRAFVEVDDHLGATRCTTQITGLRMMAGDRPGAEARQRRGWQHLEQAGPCLERGYHAVACLRCDVHNPTTLPHLTDLARI